MSREPITVRLKPDDKAMLEDVARGASLDASTIARLMIEQQLKRFAAMEQPNLFEMLAEIPEAS